MKQFFYAFLVFSALLLYGDEEWRETPLSPVEEKILGVYYDLSKDPSIVLAQGAVEPIKLSPAAEREDPLYKVHIGDVLHISLYGERGTRSSVIVGADGKINFLNVQGLPAVGSTIPDIRKRLLVELKKFYRFPIVVITPIQFAGEFFTVIGEVNDPGRKPLLGNTTLISGLCLAQGFRTRIFRQQTVDLVDYDHSFLSRDGKLVPLDFRRLIVEGDLSQDVRLLPSDYIFIASQNTMKVFVVGEVFHPVTVNYLTPISLADAVAEAGGTTLRASSRAMVLRGAIGCPRWFCIDLNRILKGDAGDFPLEPNDIVYIPPMTFTNLKEYVQNGISAFVSIVANVAGTNAFLEIYPKAKGANVISPAPVITPIVTPVVPAPAPVAP